MTINLPGPRLEMLDYALLVRYREILKVLKADEAEVYIIA